MEAYRHPERALRHLLAGVFIYGMALPLVFLDICAEIYHRVTFPLYGIPYVKRAAYITYDREKLAYLNAAQKFNCLYCSYANGLIRYCAEIGARSEKYWCAIQHQKTPGFIQPDYQKDFLPFGDEKAFEEFVDKK